MTWKHTFWIKITVLASFFVLFCFWVWDGSLELLCSLFDITRLLSKMVLDWLCQKRTSLFDRNCTKARIKRNNTKKWKWKCNKLLCTLRRSQRVTKKWSPKLLRTKDRFIKIRTRTVATLLLFWFEFLWISFFLALAESIEEMKISNPYLRHHWSLLFVINSVISGVWQTFISLFRHECFKHPIYGLVICSLLKQPVMLLCPAALCHQHLHHWRIILVKS